MPSLIQKGGPNGEPKVAQTANKIDKKEAKLANKNEHFLWFSGVKA